MTEDGIVFEPALFDELQDVMDDTLRDIARAQEQRIERAIRGAVRAGYDGVDINRSGRPGSHEIVEIVPWTYPAPEGANGYRTERYTWDWFSDESLELLLTTSNPLEVLGSR